MGVSSPFFVSPQVLATIVEEPKKEVEKDIIQYTVKEGDTLAGIAEKFDINLNTLLWANDLTSKSVIKPGQKLIILPIDGIMHMVKDGDTIESLAKYYQAKTDDIAEFNEIENGKIFIGDILIIPNGRMPAPKPTTTTPSSSIEPQLTLPDSYFIIPTSGKITQTRHLYNAVDIANQCGTPIYAAAGGTVQIASTKWPYGNYIRILHPNGVVTLYAHLSRILITSNQVVSQGQIIGYIGATGNSTGCHLHFEVRGATNPLTGYLLGTNLKF